MKIATGQGIGDSLWTTLKAQGFADQFGDGIVELGTIVWDCNAAEGRATDFLQRIPQLNAHVHQVPRMAHTHGPALRAGPPTDELGRYRYLEDGFDSLPDVFVALPNAHLEYGRRLEEWFPSVPTDWDLLKRDYQESPAETAFATTFAMSHGPYVVVYMGSVRMNSGDGHNRNGLWSMQDWASLGKRLQHHGVRLVMVGTLDDLEYAEQVQALDLTVAWINRVATWPICTTFAVIRRAKLVVSYQSGMGIGAHYFGVPTAIFWRPEGDSISSAYYLTFDERMAHAWARPDWQQTQSLLPCIYTKHHIEDIVTWAKLWI